MTKLKIKQLPHAEGLPLPKYETPGSAGMDLTAAIDEAMPLLSTRGTVLQIAKYDNFPSYKNLVTVPTGLIMEIPQGYEGQIRPRSGLAANYGITVLNTPGTIDSDYRGEVKVILVNVSGEDFWIQRGMRIAQLVIAPVTQMEIESVAEISDDTERGSGGFGSTGIVSDGIDPTTGKNILLG